LREVLKDANKKLLYFETDINAISGNIIYSTLYMEKTKICYNCKIPQELSNFGLLKNSPDNHRYDCKSCRKEYRSKNKNRIKEKQKEYYSKNKSILSEKNKQYRVEHKEEIFIQRKEYRNREDIKKHIKAKNREYLPIRSEKIKEKRKTDLNFRISQVLRSKIHKVIRGQKTSCSNLLGCDMLFLKKWIEFRFDDKMNWNNLGTYWEIDHILPINAFDFMIENEKTICFHWTNLQPLTCIENRRKTDKIMYHYYLNNIVNINRFNSKYKDFLGYQVLNESLKWLRDKELRYGKNPAYDDNKQLSEIDNPQPSS
jgi:hypothetical protein